MRSAMRWRILSIVCSGRDCTKCHSMARDLPMASIIASCGRSAANVRVRLFLQNNGQRLTFRDRIKHLPLRQILIFFGTLLIVGILRWGALAAFWIVGWVSYFLVKLVFTVKKKVDQKSAERRA